MGASFQERSGYNPIYTAFEAAIKPDTDPADYWSENAAFYVLRTNEQTSEALNLVWVAAGRRRDKDRLVVSDAQ